MHNFGHDWATLFSLSSLLSLLTLTVLEIVLGVDNVIFIAIVAGKLPRNLQGRARVIGLSLAFLFRVALLISITWILGLDKPVLSWWGFDASGKDMILFAGGIFLLIKTTGEIRERMRGEEEDSKLTLKKISLNSVILQIVFIDILFSFDSILTAVSMVSNVLIMIGAVMLAMFLMIAFSGKVSDFINRHPTMKMLALAFLLMIACILLLDAAHFDVDTIKPYLYVSITFALGVELLNMRERSLKSKKEKSE